MWKITLCCNILILALFWLLCQVMITPAENLFVIYAETAGSLPILTDFAIQIRFQSVLIPASCAIITVLIGRQMRLKTETKRNEWLALHCSLCLLIGLSMLTFFALASILPFLKIAAAIL